MVSPEVEARILRLHHAEGWKVGQIARELGVHHSVVRRVLAQSGVSQGLYFVRPSIVDPYLPFIVETLERFPRLQASRLYNMVRQRGYSGGPDHFRHVVARHRPKPAAETFLRLRTLPGEQAQVDWGSFGTLRVGRAERRLAAFVLVLSWSRALFVRFYLDQRLENFMRGHEAAFESFGGVPRVCLYDNLKSVVLERHAEAIRFHPSFLAFAGHYRFEPRPVGVRRANEKGRVERAIRYVRESFFAARRVRDLDTLNLEVQRWCLDVAYKRPCPGDSTLSVAEALEQERPRLLQRPATAFPTDEQVTVYARKTPYIRFDRNDYSIPHSKTRRPLTVVAAPRTVRLFDGQELIATHSRSYDKGQVIEDPSHVRALVESKRRARRERAIDRLERAAPLSRDILQELAEHGHNLGSATQMLSQLLDRHGAHELQAALAEAIKAGTLYPHAVRQILERRLNERGLPPPMPVRVENDIDVSVTPHELDSYDELQEVPDEDAPEE